MKNRIILAAPVPRATSRGMSLVELLVAIGIGTLIVAAMALLFANNSRSRGETERAARKIENGRYGLEILRGELYHAGYLAELDPQGLAMPAAKPDLCDITLLSLRLALGVHIQGYDNMAATTLSCLPPSGLTDVKVGTDAVVVRRASACTALNPVTAGCTGLAANAPAFQASSCGNATELGSANKTAHYKLDTTLGTLTLTKRDCTSTWIAARPQTSGPAGVRRYVVRIYYVANNDVAGDGIPTLKYRELGAGAFNAPVSLVQGVENLQLEYGLDTDANGDADVYTAAPDLYLGCTDVTVPTCVGHWTSVVSTKVHLLSRSVDPSPGHNDTNTYVLGRKANGEPNSFTGLPPAYKRKVFQEVVRLQNPSGRKATP